MLSAIAPSSNPPASGFRVLARSLQAVQPMVLKNHPDATILHSVQISTLTERAQVRHCSQARLHGGVPAGQHFDGAGDKAIRSIASNGLEREFDANAELIDAMIITWRAMADRAAKPKCGS